MSKASPMLAEQFDTLEQQQEAARLGMWIFIATEIMFFGGLFVSYLIYRLQYPHAFAVASHHTSMLFGTLNTAILLTSSLWMALAVHSAQIGSGKIIRYLALTILFALGFLVVKGFEYADDIHQHLVPGGAFGIPGEPKAQLFFYFYWAMTALHGLHVIIGIGLLSVMTWLASRNRFTPEYHNPLEISGLYWHFVDIVWIFLYPLLYLIGRHV